MIAIAKVTAQISIVTKIAHAIVKKRIAHVTIIALAKLKNSDYFVNQSANATNNLTSYNI